MNPSGGCGTCASVVENGGACDESNRLYCPPGQSCVEGQCTDNVPPGLGEYGPRHPEGSDCIANRDCEIDLYCAFRADRPELGTCSVPPSAGAPCATGIWFNGQPPETNVCDLYSYCGEDILCHEAPAAGQPCAQDRLNGPQHCAEGAWCTAQTYQCVAFKGTGEACASDGECGAGLHCIASGVCGTTLQPGESCSGAATEMCGYGSTCESDVCAYPETIDTYEQSCL